MKLKRIAFCLSILLACSAGVSAQDDSTGVRALIGTPEISSTAVPSTVPSGTICGSPGEKKTVYGFYYYGGVQYYNPVGWVLKCGGSEAVVTGTGCTGSCTGSNTSTTGLWAITGSCPSGYTLKGAAYYTTVDKGGGYGGSNDQTSISSVDAWCQKN